MSGFTKLFSAITSSSIWNEDDITRLVWITMLAMADSNGVVYASIGGLAHTARVKRDPCEKAIQKLESPDDDSRSPEFEGRRIKRIEGGFLLLNYAKYREARSEDERRLYMKEYMKEYRKIGVNNRKQKLTRVSRRKPPLAQAEAEADNIPCSPPMGDGKELWKELPKNLDTDEFREEWMKWVKYRKEINKRLTESTVREQWLMLSNLGPSSAITCLRNSIQNSWQGLFPDGRGHNGTRTPQKQPLPTAADIRKEQDRLVALEEERLRKNGHAD